MAAAAAGFVEEVRAALASRDFAAARGLCERQLARQPGDAGALRQLGLVEACAGRRGQALRAAMAACELAPDDARAWCDLGRVLALAGRLEDAVACFAEAVAIDKGSADAWHNLGTALRRLGRREPAFEALRNALLIDGTRAQTYLTLGALLVEAGQPDDALECFERAARHDPSLAQARSRIAGQMWERGKVLRAEALYRQSLALDPEHVPGWFGLGRALEDVGRAGDARDAYRNALRRRRGHAQALGQLVALLEQGDDEAAEWCGLAAELLRDPATPDQARALIGYGLAKHHDRKGDIAAAAGAGSLANAARRRIAGPLDRKALAARIDGIMRTCTAEFFADRRRFGIGNDQPVLIVGLPRSGTTLTEQILAAHAVVHGAGELPDLARQASRVAGPDRERWQAAALLDEDGSRRQAAAYLQALRDGAPKPCLRIVDKSPLNFFDLAFAALLFPQSRVIHCRRAAADTAVSIWLENFNPDQRYATDFDDLAFFTRQYERLMAHWRDVLPLPILDVRYEETVADLERQARRLAAFLDVPWDPACLDFHARAKVIRTPSRWQVRQPIYARSVGRWRTYAAHLPDLGMAFAP